MRKPICAALSAVLLAGALSLAGCANDNDADDDSSEHSDKSRPSYSSESDKDDGNGGESVSTAFEPVDIFNDQHNKMITDFVKIVISREIGYDDELSGLGLSDINGETYWYLTGTLKNTGEKVLDLSNVRIDFYYGERIFGGVAASPQGSKVAVGDEVEVYLCCSVSDEYNEQMSELYNSGELGLDSISYKMEIGFEDNFAAVDSNAPISGLAHKYVLDFSQPLRDEAAIKSASYIAYGIKSMVNEWVIDRDINGEPLIKPSEGCDYAKISGVVEDGALSLTLSDMEEELDISGLESYFTNFDFTTAKFEIYIDNKGKCAAAVFSEDLNAMFPRFVDTDKGWYAEWDADKPLQGFIDGVPIGISPPWSYS